MLDCGRFYWSLLPSLKVASYRKNINSKFFSSDTSILSSILILKFKFQNLKTFKRYVICFSISMFNTFIILDMFRFLNLGAGFITVAVGWAVHEQRHRW